jgi:hypothetical protein
LGSIREKKQKGEKYSLKMNAVLNYKDEKFLDCDFGSTIDVSLDSNNGVFRRYHVGNAPMKWMDPLGLIKGKCLMAKALVVHGAGHFAIGAGLVYVGFAAEASVAGAVEGLHAFGMAIQFLGMGGYEMYYGYSLWRECEDEPDVDAVTGAAKCTERK